MSSRLPSILAWSVWALCVVVVVVSAVWPQAPNDPGDIADTVAIALMLLVVASVGALVAARQPRNAIGWLFCGSILIQQLGVAALEYGVYGLATTRVAFPGAIGATVVGGWLRGLGWLLLPTFLLLLFPDGRLLSRRWRPAAWIVVVSLTFSSALTLFGQDLTDIDQRLAGVRNPCALIGADLTKVLQGVYFLVFVALIAVCTAAVIVRFRRSRGQERQQLKWFTYAAALCLLIFLGIVCSAFLTPILLPGIVFYLAIVGLPVGAGIAILRYRLYDIDLIINRTLVYGSLTAILAAIYFGVVIALQAVVGTLTGQTKPQPVVIVASTLLIAALFTPLRRRLQAGIDRRFYRRRYDAVKTLATFGATLRTEMDVERLREHMLAVVDQTMQPALVSLWLSMSEPFMRDTSNAWDEAQR